MDIGTNSIRLLVVRVRPGHTYTVLRQLKETVRLGEGEFTHQLLQPGAITRAVAVVREFAALSRASGAQEIIAVATAATREAANQDLFLRRLRDDAGVDVHVISGKEEARLIYLGIISGIEASESQTFCIDIGGGSTEVMVGASEEPAYLNSLRLGAIRLTTRFLGEFPGPIPPHLYERICNEVKNHAALTLNELREYGFDRATGSSGTVENLAEMSARRFLGRPWRRDDVMTRAQLRELVVHLCSLPLEERRKVPGINPQRADIIIGGAAVLETIMAELDIPQISVSDRGLRDGLLADYMARHGQGMGEGMSVRARSILQLGRNCRFNEEHAWNTSHLAIMLFDSAREAGLHDLGEWQRGLLEYAALAHHIGTFLTYSGYQKHSAYLVRNADLLGFDETELSIMAATVLYHRKSLPRRKDPEFAALSPEAQQTVRMLALFLRLAENLDRSQTSNIASARIERRPEGGLVLRIAPVREYQVEQSGVEKELEAFNKTFGEPLTLAPESR